MTGTKPRPSRGVCPHATDHRRGGYRRIPAGSRRDTNLSGWGVRRVIAGARVFIQGELRPLDIIIDGERIAGLASRREWPEDGGTEVVDAPGLIAIPGGVDVHVHTREPGYTHK